MPYDRQTRSGLLVILSVAAVGLVAGNTLGALIVWVAEWFGL